MFENLAPCHGKQVGTMGLRSYKIDKPAVLKARLGSKPPAHPQLPQFAERREGVMIVNVHSANGA